MKPRIFFNGIYWRCISFGVFGIRIAGNGATPEAAYLDWQKRLWIKSPLGQSLLAHDAIKIVAMVDAA